jgi:tetratricopeptide (TPR) repeat protein
MRLSGQNRRPKRPWISTTRWGKAHLTLARVIQLYDWDWPRVEQEYRRALALNRNDALAHGLFGEFLQEMGRNQEALAEFRRGAALDPLNAWRVSDVGFAFYTARQYEEAVGVFQKGLAVDPKDADVHMGLGWVDGQRRCTPRRLRSWRRQSA